MKIKTVAEVLKTVGLVAPRFAALEPDRSNYKLCLLQPKGDIEYDTSGVWHRDRALAIEQFSRFMDEALARDADLAVTPEYSMPWDVLKATLQAGNGPKPGKLWAFGCESIAYSDLVAFRDELSPGVRVIFEDLTGADGNFVDPLTYVFEAPHETGKKTDLVVLVQFKTAPMSDGSNFEVKNLSRGKVIYQFGDHTSVRLYSLICSDVLGFSTETAKAIYDRSLILHLQLNPDPRHASFRAYRDELLGLNGDETEIICLNWASGVAETFDGQQKEWHNISNSAWYLKSTKLDRSHATLAHNHRRGLYYTYSKRQHLHALFFNYAPGVFVFETTKAAHMAQPPMARRSGPILTDMLFWDGGAWASGGGADDGFSEFAGEAGGAQACVEALSASNPLFVERLLALSSGEIALSETWHDVTELDSCRIDQNEIIWRMTFCQDPDSEAKKFRVARLKLCKQLMAILQTPALLPASLDDFKTGFDLNWSPARPHQNGVSTAGHAATVVYVGELRSDADIRETRDKLHHFLRAIGDDDAILAARQRVAVWHHDGAGPKLFEPLKLVKIDQPRTTSPFDITRDD